MSDSPIKFFEGQTVGIDLGTSYSVLSRLGEDGNPEVINNSHDSPITASIVVLGENGKILVGPPSEVLAQQDPARVVIAIKREMGNPRFALHYQERRMTPELISSLILTKLKTDAEKKIGPIGNAVITVPYYFNEPKRAATQYAGKIAGLNVVDIINEPTAATLVRDLPGAAEYLRHSRSRVSHAGRRGEAHPKHAELVERRVGEPARRRRRSGPTTLRQRACAPSADERLVVDDPRKLFRTKFPTSRRLTSPRWSQQVISQFMATTTAMTGLLAKANQTAKRQKKVPIL